MTPLFPPNAREGDFPLLDVCGVSYSYHSFEGETLALSNISFTVDRGEFIAVVGPSGCGKSTLLSLISGLLIPDEGSILLNGRPVTESQGAVGYMPQRDQLFEWRSIFSNAASGWKSKRKSIRNPSRSSILCLKHTAWPILKKHVHLLFPAVCVKELHLSGLL